MAPSHPPFMYGAARPDDARFPASVFDPKAVTRASWEPRPSRRRPSGPLVGFNTHPDSHHLLASRPAGSHPRLGAHTKSCVRWLRRLQLVLRVLELNAAAGALVLMVLLTKVEAATAWTLRVASALCMTHCVYAIYHLSRRPSARAPGSSAAYQVFAALADLCVVSVYAFGAFSAHQPGLPWATMLSNQQLVRAMVPALYYLLMAAAGLHLVSLALSAWLAAVFRRISLMPPDMNPLEDHLTARPLHTRNKSSTTMASSHDDGDHLPGLPFLCTRAAAAEVSPTRRYQRVDADAPPLSPAPRWPPWPPSCAGPPSDSLVPRIHQRNHHATGARGASSPSPRYSCLSLSLSQRHSALSEPESASASESESDFESASAYASECGGYESSDESHPNPLASHPPAHPTTAKHRPPLPGRGSVDDGDRQQMQMQMQMQRKSSIQPEHHFSSSPHRHLACTTTPPPPLIIAPTTTGSRRHVSSGNDYEPSYSSSSLVYERPSASGKQAVRGHAVGHFRRSS